MRGSRINSQRGGIRRWLAYAILGTSVLLSVAIACMWVSSYRYTQIMEAPSYRIQTFDGRVYCSRLGSNQVGQYWFQTRKFDASSIYFTDDLGFYESTPSTRFAGFRVAGGTLPFVAIPFWPMLVIAGLPLWLGIYRLMRKQPADGFCAGCSYNLTGNLSGVCPECGTAVPSLLISGARSSHRTGTREPERP